MEEQETKFQEIMDATIEKFSEKFEKEKDSLRQVAQKTLTQVQD